MIRAILFDFDGVLANSEPLHFEAEKTLVETNGGILTHEVFNSTLGRSMHDAISYYKAYFSLTPSVDELLRQHDYIFLKFVDASLEMMPGARNLLELLQEHGYRYAIASSGTQAYLRRALQKFNIEPLFHDNITSIEMVAHGKPEPDIFLHAACHLGVPPEQCVVVEDAISGIQAACKAQMKSLFLNADPSIEIAPFSSRRIEGLAEITVDLLRSL